MQVSKATSTQQTTSNQSTKMVAAKAEQRLAHNPQPRAMEDLTSMLHSDHQRRAFSGTQAEITRKDSLPVPSSKQTSRPNLDFVVVKAPFKQYCKVLSIHAFILKDCQRKQLPLAFVTMSRKTNNDVEVWHNRLNTVAKYGGVPFYLLVPELRTEVVDLGVRADDLERVEQRKQSSLDSHMKQTMTTTHFLKFISKFYRPSNNPLDHVIPAAAM